MTQKIVVDCDTGEEQVLPLTADDVADLALVQTDAQAREAQVQAAAAQQQADQQAVIAGLTALGQPDAAAALARLLGLPGA